MSAQTAAAVSSWFEPEREPESEPDSRSFKTAPVDRGLVHVESIMFEALRAGRIGQ